MVKEKSKKTKRYISQSHNIQYNNRTTGDLKELINVNLLEEEQVVKKACTISKEYSKSFQKIQDQIQRQKDLDKKMKMAGITGKRSLLKNFILRNNLLP